MMLNKKQGILCQQVNNSIIYLLLLRKAHLWSHLTKINGIKRKETYEVTYNWRMTVGPTLFYCLYAIVLDGAVIVLFPLLSSETFLEYITNCHIFKTSILSCCWDWRHNHNHWKRKAINNNQVLPSLAEVVTRLALIGSQYRVHFIKLKRHDEIKPRGCKKIWRGQVILDNLPFHNSKHSKMVGDWIIVYAILAVCDIRFY